MLKSYKNLSKMPIDEFKLLLEDIKHRMALIPKPTPGHRGAITLDKKVKRNVTNHSSHRAYFKK